MEFLPKVLKTTKETSFQGFEKVFRKKMHKQGLTGRANLYTDVFGKQYRLVLIMTSRTKPEILGHVVHFVFVRSLSS